MPGTARRTLAFALVAATWLAGAAAPPPPPPPHGPPGPAASTGEPRLQSLVDRCATEELARPRTNTLRGDQLALTLVDLASPGPVTARWRGAEPTYPASVMKAFLLVAAHQWMEDGRLADTPELRRALRDMIVDSSNDASHYVMDVLTGTTSGPELSPEALSAWEERRQVVTRWFVGLGYPASIHLGKKPWGDGPYGRERQAIEAFEPRRNALTTDATARLFTDIALGRIGTPARREQMLSLLRRDPTATPTPEDQVTGFIANGLPRGARLWSKAGWTSQTRHDAALVELPGGRRIVLVIFTTGHAHEEDLLPSLARSVVAALPR